MSRPSGLESPECETSNDQNRPVWMAWPGLAWNTEIQWSRPSGFGGPGTRTRDIQGSAVRHRMACARNPRVKSIRSRKAQNARHPSIERTWSRCIASANDNCRVPNPNPHPLAFRMLLRGHKLKPSKGNGVQMLCHARLGRTIVQILRCRIDYDRILTRGQHLAW